MSAHWTPTGPWMAKFRNALLPAFNPATMQLLTADYFGPLNTFANLTSNGSFEYRLYEYIEQARLEDWLLDLVAAAHERRPKNLALEQIAAELGLTLTGPRLINSTTKPLQQLIQENAKYLNLSDALEKLARIQGQVCRVVVPGGGGTGFLVAPNLVLTNQHVMDSVEKNQTNWQDVTCWFDYQESLDGSKLTTKKITEVKLHPKKWLEHSKPHSLYDWDPTLGNAGPTETDCALIRLAERIGDLPVGGATVDPDAAPRSWITANAVAPALTAGNQVIIVQHPKTEPLQATVGLVKEFNAAGTRVRYDANTKDGSSGSPCFDFDLQLVALHHAFDPAQPPKWNQAVPLGRIQEVWKADGIKLKDLSDHDPQ
jgi:V8-like Glu-specific endopeptidase